MCSNFCDIHLIPRFSDVIMPVETVCKAKILKPKSEAARLQVSDTFVRLKRFIDLMSLKKKVVLQVEGRWSFPCPI
jgi:hypothetical protein